MPDQFENQQYLNIETFRKNGEGVKTPVLFAQDGETLHVWTFAEAGKVKRIRRDGSVRIAPCTSSGAVLGEWINAKAIAEDSSQAVGHVEGLMRKKYGLLFSLFQGLGRMRKAKTTVLKITFP